VPQSEPVPFEPRRFRTAAAHYLQGRPAYAAALAPRVALLTGLAGGDGVLDLGCGPGQLARAFAPLCGGVLAVDPEPEMLRVAAEASEGITGIRFRQGSSYDLSPALVADVPPLRLAVIGRAFHWMDRADTLARLDTLLAPDGAVVLVSSHQPKLPDNAWRETYEPLLRAHEAEGSARERHDSPGWLPHEAVLLDSPFARQESITITERRRTPLVALADRALSMSSTSRARIGDRADALAAAVLDALAPFAVDGMLMEVVDSRALIAWRVAP
jgi:SAM-dependent methyltransferase